MAALDSEEYAEMLELVEMELRELLDPTSSQATTRLSLWFSADGAGRRDDNELGTTAVKKLVEALDLISLSRVVRLISRS